MELRLPGHAIRITIVGLAFWLSGCAISPLAKRASSFGAAASVISRDASAAYDTVEKTVYDAQVSSLVLDFDSKGFDPARIKPFLSGEDLEARKVLLRSLRRYSDLLQEVAGTAPIEQLNSEVAALGQQLTTLSANPALHRIAANAGEPEIKGLTTAIDAIGGFLIEGKRRKALPAILVKMQPVIDRICAVLSADLGKRPDSDGIGGRGLRGQQWLEYDQLIANQKAYVLNNKATLTAQEKSEGIVRLPALVRQQRTADDALAATQTALEDLAKTHRALLKEPRSAVTFMGLVAEMKDDGQRIADFYKSLDFK